jgi:hypothetical protein
MQKHSSRAKPEQVHTKKGLADNVHGKRRRGEPRDTQGTHGDTRGDTGGSRDTQYRYCTGKKTPGGAGTHTGHGTNTGHTDSRTSQPSQPTDAPARPRDDRIRGRLGSRGRPLRTRPSRLPLPSAVMALATVRVKKKPRKEERILFLSSHDACTHLRPRGAPVIMC